jgi:hypothetical protein
MDDGERHKILDRAHAILRETKGIVPREPCDPADDAMVKWQKMRPQPAPARRNAAPAAPDDKYANWAQILRDPMQVRTCFGIVLGEARKMSRERAAEIKQLRRELHQTRSDLAEARGELSAVRSEIKQRSATSPTILSWQFDRRHYRAIPTMSDGKPGAPLDLRPFFEMYHHETAE